MKGLLNITAPRKIIVVSARYEGTSCVLKAAKVNAKGELSSEFSVYGDVEEMVKHLGKEHAYWLHVNGTGVLTRLVDSATDYQRDLILNADPEEFYFSSVTKEPKMVVSFVRRSVCAELVERLQIQKIYLIGVSCGFAPYAVLADKGMPDLEYRLVMHQGGFAELERLTETRDRVLHQGSYIGAQELLAQVIAGFRLANEYEVNAFEYATRNTEFKEYRKFKLLGITGVSVILVLLLGNYFYLNNLNQDVVDMEAELALNNSNLTILNKLEQEEIRKQQLLTTSGVASNQFVSFYLDKIGESVPREIRLSEMIVFPLKEKLKDKRKVEISQEKIEISGWTSDNVILDDWIEKLDKAAWIKSIELLNYQKTPASEAEFRIIILLNE